MKISFNVRILRAPVKLCETTAHYANISLRLRRYVCMCVCVCMRVSSLQLPRASLVVGKRESVNGCAVFKVSSNKLGVSNT